MAELAEPRRDVRRPLLEVSSIGAAYGAATALRDVSIAIGTGELVCVVGPNGAGKTTLINVIAGLHRAAAGSMRLDGVDVTRLPPHRFCDAGIALVPEARRLFATMTVRENLELGSYRPAARRQRATLLDQVCARFPVIGTCLERPAGTLSGGQQQMVAIGRALMAQPRILLLDEPSLGLAPIIVLELFELIRRVNGEGMAVLLVEQNVAMAFEVAERAYVLEEGRIVAEDSPDALRAQPHIMRAYLGIQTVE
jgi:branched-chain amino acid transport system ATP-binding protein